MLEKLAAEKDAKKPEWISVKDRLPDKNVKHTFVILIAACFRAANTLASANFVTTGNGRRTARSLTGCRFPNRRRRKNMIKIANAEESTILF